MHDEDEVEAGAPEAPSRRAFLGLGVGVAAGAVLTREAGAQERPTRRATLAAVSDRLGQRAEWRSVNNRLVRRISMGLTAPEVARVNSIGFTRYLEEQLDPASIDDSACDARIATRYPQLGYSQATLLQQDAVFWNEIAAPVQRGIIERACFSRRQLQQRMVEFWSDHFNIQLSPSRVVDYRDVIAANALGTFGDLVRASMRSPAMLMYLDQVWSTKWGVNENYARELMELHTLGVNGGYTQADVHELARVLTGWTIDSQRNFLYNATYHDFGAKVVMGRAFPARAEAGGTAGMDEAMNFAEFIIHHPSTAKRIATKLLQWFVRPDPTALQVATVVNVFNATDGDIKAMLRAILTPANLQGAPAKLKRPFHYYASVVRGTGATIDEWTGWPQWEGVTGHLYDNAHAPLTYPTPDGFPDRAEYWAGLMVNRWNAVSSIISNWGTVGRYPRFSAAAFTADRSPAGVLAAIDTQMLGGEMTLGLRAELQRYLAGSGTLVSLQNVTNAVYLAATSPEFQYY